MRYLEEIFAVALAEIRAVRRFARTWIFVAITVLFGVISYLAYAGMHAVGSGFSSTVGSFGPRMLVTTIGMSMVVVLIVGLVFLSFDVRARDQRERMAEVLDARPIGTVALLAGRLAGQVFVLWLVVAIVMGLIQLVGITARAFDWLAGDTVEPVSMASFLLLDALPALILWGSVVIFLAVVVRNRLIVAIVALALFGGSTWLGFETPFYLAPALLSFQAYVATGSDMLPVFADGVLLVQRLATVVFALGLLVFAAALHPREDGRGRGRQLGIAGALAGFGVVGIGFLVMNAMDERARRLEWTDAHIAAQSEPRADLESVRGSVSIEPGRRLGVDLVYELVASAPLDELLFSLNPALEVSELLLDGDPVASTHESGLLRVALPIPLHAGQSVELAITAAGVPDPAFAYLDSELDMDLVHGQEGNVILLGTRASVFDARFVALMPTVRWMPLPGAATGNDDPKRYGRDFFTVDLEVEVPADWLVAGPGLRQDVGDGRFRFAPAAPVPEVALLASAFERRAMELGGVTFELLLHPGHGENLKHFADSLDVIRERIAEILNVADKAGLTYPYGGLSLVEVPARLRVFGGGWRMDSVQALPGIMMLREYGIPTARFDTAFRLLEMRGRLSDEAEGIDADAEEVDEEDGAVSEAQMIKVAILTGFFANDFSGGTLHDGVSRNFLQFQTGAKGDGAIALDYVCHELAVRLLHNRSIGEYFSPRNFSTVTRMNETMGQLVAGLVTGGGTLQVSLGGAAGPKAAAVWSRALGASLAALDPAEDGIGALDVLSLKAPAVARSIVDDLGGDTVADVLAELRRRFAGRNFTADDFDAVAADVGADLDALLGDWLGDAQLPGFIVSAAEVVRLTDGERGEPRYQVRAQVNNGESVPGLVRLGVVRGREVEETMRVWSDPIRVDGNASVEIGLVVDTPPEEVWVAPYLSLNRRDIRLELPEYDERGAVDAVPLNGGRPSEWRPPAEPGIVVDDLDPGFSIVFATPDDEEHYGLKASNWWMGEADVDHGLPMYSPFVAPPRGWMRMEVAGPWGRYRHTAASAFPGNGGASARFAVELPYAGRWRVDYHLPEVRRQEVGAAGVGIRVAAQSNMLSQPKGDFDVKVVVSGDETPVEFDAEAASLGWNDLGEFSLPEGEVSLVVSNKTVGPLVVADAVRWRPVEDR